MTLRHGHSSNGTRSATYNSWRAMKARCYQKNHEKYPSYGGRGIVVAKEWKDSFENFLVDMGERPTNKTLDRIDVNGPYSKDNCRWATAKMQNRNKQ